MSWTIDVESSHGITLRFENKVATGTLVFTRGGAHAGRSSQECPQVQAPRAIS